MKEILLEQKSKEELVLDYLAQLIKNTEFEGKTFVAGGWVRDMVMGKKSKDIDITVSMPNGGIKFANFITKKIGAYKEESNPVVFPNFGTAKFNLRGVVYKGVDLSNVDIESVMTRKEQYHDDSRKPEVDYGTPKQDVERRDLTINSLLYDISNKKILDLTGKGLDDIKNKVIRTPLDSNIIFKEDPLRMMRAIRFVVRYGWKLSDELRDSIKKNANRLKIISKERIQDELNKILLSDHPDDGIRMLMKNGLMYYIIPELYGLEGMEQNKFHEWDALEHTLRVLKNSAPRLEIRLGALFHDIGKVKAKTNKNGKIQFLGHEYHSSELVKKALKDLKYDNHIIKKVSNIVLHHMRTKSYGQDANNVSDKALRKLMHQMGDDLEDLLDLVHSDNCSHGNKGWPHNMENQVDKIREKLKKLGNFTGKLYMPIDGNKIIKWLDIKPGPDIAKIINRFKELFFENPDKINKLSDSELEVIVKNIYQNIKNCEK